MFQKLIIRYQCGILFMDGRSEHRIEISGIAGLVQAHLEKTLLHQGYLLEREVHLAFDLKELIVIALNGVVSKSSFFKSMPLLEFLTAFQL